MSAFGLEIKWKIGSEEGGTEVLRSAGVAFERAGAELVDMGKHIFPLLPPVFEAAIDRQFDSRGGGSTGGWPELSEIYAQWKAQHFPGQPLLERTGDMRTALTSPDSPLGVREWTANSFVFGTNGLEYTSFHQTGTRKMPMRPVFDFDAQFERDLMIAARKGVNAAIKEARLEEITGPISESP